jgi:hypothetical protein
MPNVRQTSLIASPSYKTNEWLDNILVSYDGYLTRAAQLYANWHDLEDPQLSPIYGDFHGFPPTILTRHPILL